MLGAARLNAQTYEEVEHDSGATIQALLVIILVSIASFVGQLLAGDDMNVVAALINGIVWGIIGWALWALFTWLIGSTLLKTDQTEADWGQLARCTGFAQTPRILNVFLFIPILGPILVLVGLVWTIIAMIVAVRQSLDYTSTWRAFFVIVLAFIPVAITSGLIGWAVWAITGGSDNGETTAFMVNGLLQVFNA
jgi:hypothetical protein